VSPAPGLGQTLLAAAARISHGPFSRKDKTQCTNYYVGIEKLEKYFTNFISIFFSERAVLMPAAACDQTHIVGRPGIVR
jgi:hypothetical protein